MTIESVAMQNLMCLETMPSPTQLQSSPPWQGGARGGLRAFLASAGTWRALLMTVIVGASVSAPCQAQNQPAADGAFFDKQVLPILQANCLKCHGGEAKIKGGL